MTPLEWTWLSIAAFAGVAISALFSGMEMGLYTLNRVRLELQVAQGDRRAAMLARLLSSPERMLAVILIGTNAANQLGAWSLANMLHGGGFGPVGSIIIDTVILVPVLLVLAEILPKELFRSHGDRWCYVLAPVMRTAEVVLTWIGLAPLCTQFGRLVGAVVGNAEAGQRPARERMAHLLLEGRDAGVLSEGQGELLNRALAIRDRTVGDEMVPWGAIRTLHTDASASQRCEAIASPWTRFPIADQDDCVVGVVSVLDLHFKPKSPINDLKVEPLRLHAQQSVPEAMRLLRAHHTPLAIVETAQGQALGIVTLKDLVGLLTGELGDS